MFRFLVVPVVIGVLAFSFAYFVIPLLFSESEVVAAFAEFVLALSNSLFATMPPLVAGYIADLNLPTVALTVALLLAIAIQILLIIGDAFVLVARGVISIFRRKPRQARPTALPAIDFEAGSAASRPGNKVLGGGFDSIDSD